MSKFKVSCLRCSGTSSRPFVAHFYYRQSHGTHVGTSEKTRLNALATKSGSISVNFKEIWTFFLLMFSRTRHSSIFEVFFTPDKSPRVGRSLFTRQQQAPRGSPADGVPATIAYKRWGFPAERPTPTCSITMEGTFMHLRVRRDVLTTFRAFKWPFCCCGEYG